MGMERMVYHINTYNFYGDITGDLEDRFDTSGYSKEDKRPLTKDGLNR